MVDVSMLYRFKSGFAAVCTVGGGQGHHNSGWIMYGDRAQEQRTKRETHRWSFCRAQVKQPGEGLAVGAVCQGSNQAY